MKMQRALRLATIVLGVVVLALAGWRVWLNKRGAMFPEPALADFGAVKDFSFTERSGKTVRLADLKGRPWIANFIFTRCMGPCPLMTRRMAELQKDYLATTNLQFVSFSVDPDYDTPQVLAKFAETYKADPERWYFLTGDRKRMRGLILESFHLAVEENGGDINHSLHFVLIDKDGHARGYYNGSEPEALTRLREDIKKISA